MGARAWVSLTILPKVQLPLQGSAFSDDEARALYPPTLSQGKTQPAFFIQSPTPSQQKEAHGWIRGDHFPGIGTQTTQSPLISSIHSTTTQNAPSAVTGSQLQRADGISGLCGKRDLRFLPPAEFPAVLPLLDRRAEGSGCKGAWLLEMPEAPPGTCSEGVAVGPPSEAALAA